MPTSRRSVLIPATAAAALVVALAGCTTSESGTGSGPTAGATSSSPTASPSPSPTDGNDLIQDASDALDAVDSFRISGEIRDNDGRIELDISYGRDDAEGTISIDGSGSVEGRKVGDTIYANGDEEFYATLQRAADAGDPDLSGLAGKWVEVDDDAPVGLRALTTFLDRDDLVDSLEPDDSDADKTFDISGPEDVEGTRAYVVTNEDGDTFAVSAEGDPVPVRITSDTDEGGKIVFDGYGDDVSVDAPADDEIVDIPAA